MRPGALLSSAYYFSAVEPIKLRSTRVKYVTGYTIDISSYETVKGGTTLRGLPGQITEIPTIVVPQGHDTEGPLSEIIVPQYFPPGSFMLFETHLEGLDHGLDQFCSSGAEQAFRDLNLVELNVVLFRCEGEERDATKGEIGAYEVPGIGKLVYCGLEGWMHPLRHIIRYNDLGHPLCANLRQGTWAFDYISGRLSKYVFRFISAFHIDNAPTWVSLSEDRQIRSRSWKNPQRGSKNGLTRSKLPCRPF